MVKSNISGINEPISRLAGEIMQRGAQVRPVDKRTPAQLAQTLNAYAQNIPEVAEHINELKKLEPKYMGLAADLIELSNTKPMLMSETNLNYYKVMSSTGKKFISHLLENLPKWSKENPEAMDFAQEVINKNDINTSKFFLAKFNPFFDKKEAANHFKATQPLVEDLSKKIFSGSYLGDFSKENKFVDIIESFIHPSVPVDGISMLSRSKNAIPVVLENVVKKGQVAEKYGGNIGAAVDVEKMLQKKSGNTEPLDMSDFILKNTNLY